MMDSTVQTALAYYARIGAALFPIPAGQKNPTGIVASFALDCSRDPAQWATWSAATLGCNFGIVAGPSCIIIVDIDTKEGCDAAWALWCELCASWGIAPVMPHVQSARGGWHVYFAVPEGVDARTLRQPDAIKGLINIRAGNGFTVAAGSFYDGTAKGEASGPYVLLSDAPPHPAPAALVEHCMRRISPAKSASPAVVGSRDPGDVAGLVKWLAERDAFVAYEDWVGVGMALRLEFGDEGREIWQLTHDGTVTPDVEETKWQSFATEPSPGVQTLNTWLDIAHKRGWRGSVRKSTAALFDGVAQLASAAGASLPAGTPGPSNAGASGVPMLAGQEVLCELAEPILQEFLSATIDAPLRPSNPDYPTLPEAMSGHGLYTSMRTCIDRMMAMGEAQGAKLRGAKIVDPLAILSLMHADVFESVKRRLRTGYSVNVPDSKIKLTASALADRVERAFVTQDAWIYDQKSGQIEHNNSDNVAVFLGILGCEVRWNAWLERVEIHGAEWREWTYVDDAIVAKLRTRANRTKTRFLPGKDFFWESLIALGQANTVDPALDMLAELQAAWDREPRLSIWLSACCGVPCDPYHQAVGRNIIGGMVKRIRRPGCKHDEIAIFHGRQGTLKSTMVRVISLSPEWFSDEIMLGDASKELVLSLAGKCVVEVAEMGMRGSTNANHVKAMLSRQVDRGRTAYARTVTARPRRNVFVGTTNDDEPLTDPTGNRRFLPVHIESDISIEWLQQNIGQLIGEAAHLEAQGHDFALPREVWGAAAEYQEAARSESDAEIRLAEWFAETPTTTLAYVHAADLTELYSMAALRGNDSTRSGIMKRLGFRRERPYIGGKRTRVWFRGPAALPKYVERDAVRYAVSKDVQGRPRVTIGMEAAPSIMPGHSHFR
jgi:predicted P-loop ATPase